jgi:hypothetical protein
MCLLVWTVYHTDAHSIYTSEIIRVSQPDLIMNHFSCLLNVDAISDIFDGVPAHHGSSRSCLQMETQAGLRMFSWIEHAGNEIGRWVEVKRFAHSTFSEHGKNIEMVSNNWDLRSDQKSDIRLPCILARSQEPANLGCRCLDSGRWSKVCDENLSRSTYASVMFLHWRCQRY